MGFTGICTGAETNGPRDGQTPPKHYSGLQPPSPATWLRVARRGAAGAGKGGGGGERKGGGDDEGEGGGPSGEGVVLGVFWVQSA